MKFFFLSLSFFWALSASALSLQYYGETVIPTGTQFQKTTIGGLSALTFHDGTLWAQSDDEGFSTPSRFYEFDLILTNGQVQLATKAVGFLHNLPLPAGSTKALLDPEGIVRLADGNFLISSEGNNDLTPHLMPRILEVQADGAYVRDLTLPALFLPELTGEPTKGLQSNEAFEGFTQTVDGRSTYAVAETAVVTDFSGDQPEQKNGDWIRILKFDENLQASTQYAYHIDALSTNAQGSEDYRGVSEALALSDTQLIIMERGDRVQNKKFIGHTVALYVADLSQAQDISSLDGNLSAQENISAVSKTKIFDFETDLQSVRPTQPVQNFEGLAWGPVLPDGRRTLLVISDNDFSRNELTQLLVFTLEGE